VGGDSRAFPVSWDYVEASLGTAWPITQASTRSKEAHVGSRGKRKGSQGRAEDRVRGRVRERVQGRPERRVESSTRRRRGTFNVGAIEGYANRLTDHVGGTSGLAGAASGLAGGSIAHRIFDNDTESSEEDFKNEVRERLDLIEERLQRLEDQVQTFLEAGGDVQELEGGADPDSSL
jgi:hypothetical protein